MARRREDDILEPVPQVPWEEVNLLVSRLPGCGMADVPAHSALWRLALDYVDVPDGRALCEATLRADRDGLLILIERNLT